MPTASESKKLQDTPHKKRPADSTNSAVLRLSVQCNVCEKEFPDKDLLQHCQSDHNLDNLGLPMQCSICRREISSKHLYQHHQINHNIRKPNTNQLGIRVKPKPDSIYRNYEKLKPGVVMVTESGDYLTLENLLLGTAQRI